MGEINLKPIEKLDEDQVKELLNILSYDKKLIKSLNGKKKTVSDEKFIADNKQWSKDNNAKIYSIMRTNNSIGLISLSHIDIQNKKAKIGYWIVSKYWNKGYTTEAFGQILDIAKENNIKFVSCSIPKDNQFSKRIWQKFNAKFKEKDDKIFPIIEL